MAVDQTLGALHVGFIWDLRSLGFSTGGFHDGLDHCGIRRGSHRDDGRDFRQLPSNAGGATSTTRRSSLDLDRDADFYDPVHWELEVVGGAARVAMHEVEEAFPEAVHSLDRI